MPEKSFPVLFIGFLCLLAGLFDNPAQSQEKKKEAKAPEPPRVLLAIPPFVPPGKTAKVLLRGRGLDLAKAVTASGKEAKILRKGKVAVPQMLVADKVGDSEIEIEVAAAIGDWLAVVVKGEGGESKSWEIPVLPGVVEEKEPNPGFRLAQDFKTPGVLYGRIQNGQDVDVFQLTGSPGSLLNVQVQAARFGSPLDPLLTLYDETGKRIRFEDDSAASRDPVATLTIPKSGKLILAIQDALDQGGDLFFYLLRVTEVRGEKPPGK